MDDYRDIEQAKEKRIKLLLEDCLSVFDRLAYDDVWISRSYLKVKGKNVAALARRIQVELKSPY